MIRQAQWVFYLVKGVSYNVKDGCRVKYPRFLQRGGVFFNMSIVTSSF